MRATVDFQNRYLAKDGTYPWLQWRARSSEDGLSFYCVARDVTQLVDREARLTAMFDSAAIGMVKMDCHGRFTSTNQAFADIVGRRADDLIGMPFTELTHADDRDFDLENLAEFQRDTFTQRTYEKRYQRPNGTVVWVRVHINRHLENGVPVGLSSQVEDVTDLQSARARLQYLASHDQLTGLTNRHRFQTHLADTLANRRQPGSVTSRALLRPGWLQTDQ